MLERSRRERPSQESESGFTLIEMVVAVLVVSIMVAVVAPHIVGAGARAQQVASTEDQQMIRSALAEYDLIHGAYPSGTTAEQLQTLVDGQLLDSVPQDPSGGTFIINDTDPNNVIVSSSVYGALGAGD